jgi:hypothetical protein
MLQRLRPRAVWLHHLLLHRVEATTAVSRFAPLDSLNLLLLEALAAPSDRPLSVRLGLEAALLNRLLADLQACGCTAAEAGSWTLTEEGRRLLREGREPCTQQECRTFWFVEGEAKHPGARFLPLDNPPVSLWPQTETWRFDVRVLRECLERNEEWKRAAGFPLDVRAIHDGTSDWRQIVLERAEQLPALFVLTEEERLEGFAVQTQGWHVQSERPVLSLVSGWREAMPELADEVELPEWRQAWRSWGQPRGLPAGELEACVLEPQGLRLRVQAPQPLLERLRSSRSDALKGEAWLLAGGAERTRTAALIELGEEGI